MAKHNVEIAIRARDEASRKLGMVGKSARALGGHLRYLATGLLTYFGARQIGSILKFGMEFEKTMSRVSALTGSTAEEQKRLEATAKRLGATTVFTAKEAAEGMSSMAKAGHDVNTIITAMPSILNLAAAGQLEVGQSAEIASGIMRGMGIGAEGLKAAIDTMTTAFITAQTDLVEMGEGLSYVGPLARTAGFNLQKTTAALMVLSNANIRGAKSGTSLRQILGALSKSSAAARLGLEKLNVETATVDGNFRELPDIIDDFNRAMEGMGTLEKTATLLQIFGKRGGPGMAALLNEGSGSLREFEKKLYDVGVAEKIAEKQLDNVAGSLTKIRSVLGDLKLSFYDMQKGPLKSWLDDLTITLQGVAFDIRNMGNSWDTAMTAMTLSAVKAGEKIWKVLRFVPAVAALNLATKAKTGKFLGEGFGADKKILQAHLTQLIAAREKKFHAELRGGAPGAPGAPGVGAGGGGGESDTIGGAIASAIRGSLAPIEGRLLTFAPGQAAGEDPAVRVARQQLEVEQKSMRLLERIASAVSGYGVPSPMALQAARFEF